MAKCVYDGKGYLPECEHCIDTVGTGVVCTHDCVIELREEIEKRDAIIKELADTMEKACYGCDCMICRDAGEETCCHKIADALVAKAREVING